MINITNFDQIKTRYNEYWALKNHDRPLLDITCPKRNYKRKEIPFSGTLKDRWLDNEYMLKSTRENLSATYYCGEAFPHAFPNLGPDIFGACLGIDLAFGENTSWAINHFSDLSVIDCNKFDENNFWLKKIIEMTELMAKDSNGDYLVGITDLHPALDGLSSLRGAQQLCFDLYEEPERVKQLSFDMLERFKELFNTLTDIISKYQKGSVNWMGVYHPKSWYVTSCDFMCMISDDMYREFVDPELRQEISFLKNSIFHLDGPDALKHLDKILEIEELKGVQWVYGAGQPTASHWIDVLKKIQNAKKMIEINIVPDDLFVLLENIRPEGVLYKITCENEDQAEYLLKIAEDNFHRTVY